MSAPEHLEEISTKERIKLVQNDQVRKYGQITIAFILIGSMIGFIGYYAMYKANDEWLLGFADKMETLMIMGIGAALAIFGLGRTVGRK